MTLLSKDGKPIEKESIMNEDAILQALYQQRYALAIAIQNVDVAVQEYIKKYYPKEAKEIEEQIKRANGYEQGKKKTKFK